MSSLNRCYRFARGFSYRKEDFGGILYHYEGNAPDPTVTFVESPFLLDLLELMEANTHVTLAEVISQVTAHFGLSSVEAEKLKHFLDNLIERGALVSA